MFDILSATWPRDGSLELFSAMQRGDWAGVLEAGRAYPSDAADELGLLARTGFFAHGDDDRAGLNSGNSSVDPRDLDAVIAMKARDPGNAYWPMMEAHLKEREGIPADRSHLLAEAAAAPTYRNPVSSFYADVQRTALAQPDDRAYLAYQILFSRAPIVTSGFVKSFVSEAGKSEEKDELLKWIGKTMTNSQTGGPSAPDAPARIDGIEGNSFDAWMGQAIARRAAGATDSPREAREKLLERFTTRSDLDLIDTAIAAECDDGKIHDYVERLRQRTVGKDRR